ncbi:MULTISPECIES: TetR/AcrR family transcriptional regulator [Thermomonosporaceae]|uniref:TetR/AcrR family transcriptional regulator n=1 Tax=Thermomonosporaceae TaxID=2012 RepID=UPI00255AF104|nr:MULTISPECIES: TetR/AcrR family transcriptional regulator [Thermomonosporaceae]MDL4770649.1 TetR/AcrR family transcriptional regulator [Actinomadura xylanilytica]
MPRPRSLTHPQIAAAALDLIDREGLAALTMRAVAGRLGVGAMSLYRYVDDRHELEGLVIDLVLGAVDVTPPPGTSWTGQVEELVGRMRAALGAHPEVVPLTMTHRQSALGLLRWSESLLGVLTRAGFDGERRVVALRSLLGYLNGAIQLEHLGPLSGAGTEAMAALPPAEFPFLAETAARARRVPADEEFRRGLAVVLAGLAGA